MPLCYAQSVMERILYRYRRLALIALVCSTAGISLARPSQEPITKFRPVDFRVRRLAPSAFAELAPNIRRELERRGCTVPQVSANNQPHNVIKGEFTRKGQTDWAVLCSVNQASKILVFRNASVRNPSEFAREPDVDELQATGGDAVAYSRAISGVDRVYILSHCCPGKLLQWEHKRRRFSAMHAFGVKTIRNSKGVESILGGLLRSGDNAG